MPLITAHQAQLATWTSGLDHQLSKGVEFDLEADPCFLTDKEEVKVLPCRKCKRVCVCNRYAAPGKTECTNCREGSHAPTKVREFDRSKDTHTLTDKDETKEVPCRSCGRPCIVSQFAAPAKVACNDCRGSVPRPRRRISIEKGDDGRYHEQVKVDNPGDVQWTQWTIGAPMDVDRLYLPDERAEFEKVRTAALEAGRAAKKAKESRHAAEGRLADIPEHLDAERKQAEDDVAEADQLEVQQLDLQKTNQERQTELARIAYIRGALAVGYKIEQRDGRRYLVRGERDVAIPDDFLSAKGYEIAAQPYKYNPAHAAVYAAMVADDLKAKSRA